MRFRGGTVSGTAKMGTYCMMKSREVNGRALAPPSFRTSTRHASSRPEHLPLVPNPLPSPMQSNDGPFLFSSWKKEPTYAYAGLPPSHGPPVLDDRRMDSLLSDILRYPYYPQVNAEARNHIFCDALLIVNEHGYPVWSHSGSG